MFNTCDFVHLLIKSQLNQLITDKIKAQVGRDRELMTHYRVISTETDNYINSVN